MVFGCILRELQTAHREGVKRLISGGIPNKWVFLCILRELQTAHREGVKRLISGGIPNKWVLGCIKRDLQTAHREGVKRLISGGIPNKWVFWMYKERSTDSSQRGSQKAEIWWYSQQVGFAVVTMPTMPTPLSTSHISLPWPISHASFHHLPLPTTFYRPFLLALSTLMHFSRHDHPSIMAHVIWLIYLIHFY